MRERDVRLGGEVAATQWGRKVDSAVDGKANTAAKSHHFNRTTAVRGAEDRH